MSGIVCTPALANSVACFERATSLQPTDLLSGMQQTGPDRMPQSAGIEIGTLTSYLRTALVGPGVIHAGSDHRLYDQNGQPLYIRSITCFANTFALFSDGYRFDWHIRNSQNPNNIPTVSPPINRGGGFGKWLSYTWQDDATAFAYIKSFQGFGFNCIRTWVGIGMLETAAFTDPVTGLSFPPELELLDKMVQYTAQLGMYIWLTFGQGSVPTDIFTDFWATLAARYRTANNVIFDIENEPAAGTVYITPSNPTLTTPYLTIMPTLQSWEDRFYPAIAAIRAAGFVGPIGVQPWNNLWDISNIQAALNSAPLNADPNLLVLSHIFYIYGDTTVTFASKRPQLDADVYNYTKYYCCLLGEMGQSNGFNFADPTASLAWITEAVGWAQKEGFNGTNFFTAQPLANNYNNIWDNTTEFTTLGNLTNWGNSVTGYSTYSANQLVQLVPNVTSTAGPLTDTTGTSITFRRVARRVDMTLNISIVTNGSAAGTLLALLPTPAPSNAYVTVMGFSSPSMGSGAASLVQIRLLGLYAEITNLDGTYPGADGVTITGTVTYYAESTVDFTYTPQAFNNDIWYTRGGLITGLPDGQQGTIITTLDMTGGDGAIQRVVATNSSKMTLFRNAANFLQLQLRNAADTVICDVSANVVTNIAAPKHTVFISWDLSVPEVFIFLKGVNRTDTPVTLVNDTIDYTDSNFAIGGLVGGTQLLQSNMDFFWFDNTFWAPGNFINNGAFFDEFDVPVELGHYGDALLGRLPLIFMRNLTPATTFANNFGTGGGMTKNP